MKNILFLLSTILISINILSQDIITTRSGDEIEAKVLEINTLEITYKKFNNLEGPNYIIPKNDVFMIKYQNGEKELFSQDDAKKEQKEKTKTNNEKNNHLDFHISVGSDPKTFEEYQNGGTIYGLTFIHFFENNFGIKTGLSGLYIPALQNSAIQNTLGLSNIDDNRFGVSLKGVYKSEKKIGFYSEAGFTYYIPVFSNWGSSNSTYYEQLSGSLRLSGIAFETLLGANYHINDKFSLYSGVAFHVLPYAYEYYSYSKGSTVTTRETRLGYIGIELGLRYKLKKK